MPGSTTTRAQHQILEAWVGSPSLAAGGESPITQQGTVWPLLPGVEFRVYNIAMRLQSQSSPSNLIKVKDFNIEALILNNGGDILVQLPIAGDVFTDPAILGVTGGASFERHGDPLFRLAAGFLISGNSIPTGIVTNAASVQLNWTADVVNLDAVNQQPMNTYFTALLSFINQTG